MNKTRDKIIKYIESNGRVSPKELTDLLEITPRAVFKQLKTLRDAGVLYTLGTPPEVFYTLKDSGSESVFYGELDTDALAIINQNFVTITPLGNYLKGIEAFVYWCNSRNLPIEKTSLEYMNIINKYSSLKKNGFLNAMEKLKSTFSKVYLDEVYYLDYYSIEVFGKTKLGQQLLYAKQSQSISLIKELTSDIRPLILDFITKNNIEGVLFVPPTVKREVQLMKELERNLLLPIKSISISKLKTEILIPQKTLTKIKDRVENAKNTFVITEKRKFSNILILDDALGSGATLNEIALLLRNKNLVSGKIFGMAITGSIKGFDVISEV